MRRAGVTTTLRRSAVKLELRLARSEIGEQDHAHQRIEQLAERLFVGFQQARVQHAEDGRHGALAVTAAMRAAKPRFAPPR